MIYYQATMRHDEKTFQALAHMQYDLFCKRNLVTRTVIGVAAMGEQAGQGHRGGGT